MRLQYILPICSVFWTSVPVHGMITQLGLRPHPTGSSAPETITTTLSFCWSDQQVYTTLSFRQVGPSPPASAVARPFFPYYWNPYPVISGSITIFTLYPGFGHPYGDSHISGTWARTDHHFSSAPLDSTAPGPPGNDVDL